MSFDLLSKSMLVLMNVLGICTYTDGRSKAHRLRLENLRNLLKLKASIEAHINASAKKIERAFLAANQEFYITLEGRIRDMG